MRGNMRDYSLAALLAVPAVFAAADVRSDTELEKLEDRVKQYAHSHYEETQKAGKSVRDYATIKTDIEKMLADSGVTVERDGTDYLIDGEKILSVSLNNETGIIDFHLGRLIVRELKDVEIEGTVFRVKEYVIGNAHVSSYQRFVNGQGYFATTNVKDGKIYIFMEEIKPQIDNAWDIVQGKWDSRITNAPEHRSYRLFVDLVKREYGHL